MKTNVSLHDFREAFRVMGRGDQFSYVGLNVLYDWFEQYEDDCGEEIELDVIAICCDFTEYDLEELVREYMPYNEETKDFEDLDEWVEWLNDQTICIPVDKSSAIVQCF